MKGVGVCGCVSVNLASAIAKTFWELYKSVNCNFRELNSIYYSSQNVASNSATGTLLVAVERNASG